MKIQVNDSFKVCLLGQFTSPTQTQFGPNQTVICSLWSGEQLSESELNNLHQTHFNGNTYDEGWAVSSTNGLPSSGRVELVRLVYLNFSDRVVGSNIFERIFQFSKTNVVGKAIASGTASFFTLCITDTNFNGPPAGRKTNFILFGTCGEYSSTADIQLRSISIQEGMPISLADIKFNFNFTN